MVDLSSGLRVTTCTRVLLHRWWVPQLAAPHWRLYRNREAGASLVLADGEYHLLPGRPVLVAPHTTGTVRLAASVSHLYLHFTLAPPWTGARAGVYPCAQDRRLTRYLDEIETLLDYREPAARLALLAPAAVLHALVDLPARVWRDPEHDERLVRVLDAMEASIAAPLANRDLARVAGMQVAAFARRFKQVTGTSPQVWYAHRRIDYAADLLARSDLDIEAIAERAGFCDRAHFTRVFTRIRGLAPAGWRRQVRADTQEPRDGVLPGSRQREAHRS